MIWRLCIFPMEKTDGLYSSTLSGNSDHFNLRLSDQIFTGKNMDREAWLLFFILQPRTFTHGFNLSFMANGKYFGRDMVSADIFI